MQKGEYFYTFISVGIKDNVIEWQKRSLIDYNIYC
jgi:hypothetical protein